VRRDNRRLCRNGLREGGPEAVHDGLDGPHVIDELEDQPRISAEDAIREARVGLGVESRSQARGGV
jgi:hypothetical protein